MNDQDQSIWMAIGADGVLDNAGHKSPVVIDAVSAHMQQMRPAVLVTLTWDQGKDMAEHKRLQAEAGVPMVAPS